MQSAIERYTEDFKILPRYLFRATEKDLEIVGSQNQIHSKYLANALLFCHPSRETRRGFSNTVTFVPLPGIPYAATTSHISRTVTHERDEKYTQHLGV
jgi:hypothetical protein